jgi:hypothetical protein
MRPREKKNEERERVRKKKNSNRDKIAQKRGGEINLPRESLLKRKIRLTHSTK